MPARESVALARTSPSKVVAVSSISAHNSPGPSQTPDVSRIGSLVNPPGTPSASASRLAGSMVTTTQRRPLRAPPAARAPPPRWSCRLRRSRSTPRRRPSRSRRRGRSFLLPQAHRPAPRSRRCREPGRQRAAGVAVRGRAPRRAATSRADGARAAALRKSAAARSGVLERSQLCRQIVALVEGIDHDRPEPQTAFVLQRVRRLDDLVDRCGLGQRHQDHLAASSGRTTARRRRRPGSVSVRRAPASTSWPAPSGT